MRRAFALCACVLIASMMRADDDIAKALHTLARVQRIANDIESHRAPKIAGEISARARTARRAAARRDRDDEAQGRGLAATGRGEQGINESGQVDDVRLLKSVAPELDQSAIDAIRRWTFVPVLRDGTPIAVSYRMPVSFCIVR